MAHRYQEELFQAAREAGLCEGCPALLERLFQLNAMIVEDETDATLTDQELEDSSNNNYFLRQLDLAGKDTVREGRKTRRETMINLYAGQMKALGALGLEEPCQVRKVVKGHDKPNITTAQYEQWTSWSAAMRDGYLFQDFEGQSQNAPRCELVVRTNNKLIELIFGDGAASGD